MIKEFTPVFVFVIILGLAARISFDIPYTSINITGQTLALLLMASLTKPHTALLGILLYLILGLIGVPLFSEGNQGWEYFKGDSLGYFIGFVVATCFVSFSLAIANYKMSWIRLLNIHLVGTLIILVLGSVRLGLNYGWSSAMSSGFQPFLVGGLIKSVVSSLLAYWILKSKWSYISRLVSK
jgi:biotin transport system substrate-specific component